MEQSPLSNTKWKLFPGKFSFPPMSAGEPYCLLGPVLGTVLCRQASPCLGTCPRNGTIHTGPFSWLGACPQNCTVQAGLFFWLGDCPRNCTIQASSLPQLLVSSRLPAVREATENERRRKRESEQLKRYSVIWRSGRAANWARRGKSVIC